MYPISTISSLKVSEITRVLFSSDIGSLFEGDYIYFGPHIKLPGSRLLSIVQDLVDRLMALARNPENGESQKASECLGRFYEYGLNDSRYNEIRACDRKYRKDYQYAIDWYIKAKSRLAVIRVALAWWNHAKAYRQYDEGNTLHITILLPLINAFQDGGAQHWLSDLFDSCKETVVARDFCGNTVDLDERLFELYIDLIDTMIYCKGLAVAFDACKVVSTDISNYERKFLYCSYVISEMMICCLIEGPYTKGEVDAELKFSVYEFAHTYYRNPLAALRLAEMSREASSGDDAEAKSLVYANQACEYVWEVISVTVKNPNWCWRPRFSEVPQANGSARSYQSAELLSRMIAMLEEIKNKWPQSNALSVLDAFEGFKAWAEVIVLLKIDPQTVMFHDTKVVEDTHRKLCYENAKLSHDKGYLPGSELFLHVILLGLAESGHVNYQAVLECYERLLSYETYSLNQSSLSHLCELLHYEDKLIREKARDIAIVYLARVSSPMVLDVFLRGDSQQNEEFKAVKGFAYFRLGQLFADEKNVGIILACPKALRDYLDTLVAVWKRNIIGVIPKDYAKACYEKAKWLGWHEARENIEALTRSASLLRITQQNERPREAPSDAARAAAGESEPTTPRMSQHYDRL